MGAFELIDWLIIGGYLIVAFVIGLYFTRKAGEGMDSYFVAGRSLPWWWLGISILATTFAADTPLAVAGLTAKEGIAGNWFWWNWSITYITVAVFFAAKWRKSRVLTDVEFVELRYSGRAASFLRGFKSIYFGLVFNCLILGWVLTAMVKICTPFIQWQEFLSPQLWNGISNVFPSFFLFKGDLNATLTILAIVLVVAIYSSLGGIRGVIITDLFQFFIAFITAIVFAWMAVDYAGGLGELKQSIVTVYGTKRASDILAFVPGPELGLIAFPVFGIYMVVQWWARYDSDGSGYIAQRLNTAKSPKDARKGGLLFGIGFIVLRSWPWILVGLVGLVLFPMDDPVRYHEIGSQFQGEQGGDRELVYPVLMKMILPAGLLGLTFTSLMAAFMSTVDTHLNWGSSYLMNDLYKRFINPEATDKTLIRGSRVTVFVITLAAILISAQMDSIAGAWKFFLMLASGLGVAQLLRWLWWRANAWTEITGMSMGLFLSLFISLKFPDLNPTYSLAIIALVSLTACVLVSFLTPAVDRDKLDVFVDRCQPVGFWRRSADINHLSINNFKEQLITWICALVSAFSLLFGIGHLMLGPLWLGGLELITGLIFLRFCWVRVNQQDDE
jgi:SSS family transporter